MSDGYKIKPLERGDRKRHFLSAAFANLVLRRLNALIGLKVQRGGKDNFTFSDGNAILTIQREGTASGETVDIEVCNPDTGTSTTYRVSGTEV